MIILGNRSGHRPQALLVRPASADAQIMAASLRMAAAITAAAITAAIAAVLLWHG